MFWYTKELGLGQGQYQVIIYELTRGVTFRNFYYAHVSAINFYFFIIVSTGFSLTTSFDHFYIVKANYV